MDRTRTLACRFLRGLLQYGESLVEGELLYCGHYVLRLKG